MSSSIKRNFQQFMLLMWKSALLRKRHYITTAFEFLLPLLLPLIIVIILNASVSPRDLPEHNKGSLPDRKNETIYHPYNPLIMKTATDYDFPCNILYTPNSTFVISLIEGAVNKLEIPDTLRRKCIKYTAMDSEEDMVYFTSKKAIQSYRSNILGIVVNNLTDELHYKLRFSDHGFDTNTLYPFTLGNSGPRSYDEYNSSYFWGFQLAIEQTYIEMRGNSDIKRLQVLMQRFPYPSYEDTSSAFSIFDLIPTFITYGLVVFCSVIVKRTADEKANRAKEMMKMIGMNDWVYYSSIFLNNYILLIIISLIITLLFIIPFQRGISVIVYSDSSIFLLILLLYSVSVILFCLAITTFFNKASIAVIIALVLWIVSFSLISNFYFGIGSGSNFAFLTLGQKLSICLLPSGALLMACRIMSVLESYSVGVHWSNINFMYSDINLPMVMGMMLASHLLYIIIIWYVDAVWPWQHGIPKPYYFPFTKSYWCGSLPVPTDDTEHCYDRNEEYFEDDPIGHTPGIVISNLTKAYQTGLHSKLAVDNLSLSVFNGQITALLGHNGAGKTTTMNVLTGLYPPSSGTASINGYDIIKDTKLARSNLGLCPQHNVLYETLSVDEHLKLFAGLKGIPWSELENEVAETLKLIDLEDKRKELSKNLSGGMKRKLSLGMAITGNSQVLILDEPTSGMDPQARRIVWDMLQNIRHSRTILLTTHYMEEADILGDRIAIMAEGIIQCCGSPLFLKKKFGAGYHLRIIKVQHCNVQKITDTIKSYVPEAQLENSVNNELYYSLQSIKSSSFEKLFGHLEKSKKELGIEACGVTVTTMEDVFLNVGHHIELKKSTSIENIETMLELDGQSDESRCLVLNSRLEGHYRILQQAKGLLLKRFHYNKRYWFLLIFQAIFPLLIFTLMIWLNDYFISKQGKVSYPPLNLNLESMFGKSVGFYNFDQADDDFSTRYKYILQGAGVSASSQSDPTAYILNEGEKNMADYLRKYLVGGERYEVDSNGLLVLKSWYNGEPYHVGSISLNLMNNAILKNLTGNSAASIKVTNAPLKLNTNVFSGVDDNKMLIALFTGNFISLILSYLSSSFVLFPIHERVSKAKLLQLMTGVSGPLFWLVTFVGDFFVYIICCLIMLISFAFVDSQHAFIEHPEAIGTSLILLLAYGWCSLPLTYLASFIPKKISTGFNILTIFHTVTGMITLNVMLSIRGIISEKKVQTAVWFLRLFPNFAVSWGFGNLFSTAYSNIKCNKLSPNMQDYICDDLFKQNNSLFSCCKDLCQNYSRCFQKTPLISWDKDSCGQDLFFMFISGILFFIILFFMETGFHSIWYKIKNAIEKRLNRTTFLMTQQNDEDVVNEQQRVKYLYSQGGSREEALVVLDLTKKFGSIIAVDHLTFAVHKKECFGLLGINGAGKTSTFRMLTGDLDHTEGNALIDNSTLKDNLKLFQSFIGYCPQFDALLDRLTGREMLFLLARLRGMPEASIPGAVDYLIQMVDLQKHADKKTQDYSGGNKRKLSLALAVIGSPPVIFLDEPTSGVDPVARRKIWNMLVTAREVTGAAIILTTHSMEECEALCTRLAIMVNGQFRCMGSTQHLKSKFGQGFTVIIKLKRELSMDEDYVQRAKNYVETTFPKSVLKDIHQGILYYHITDTTVPWSHLFGAMERAKESLELEDYLISDTTLEQIFLAFAKAQRKTDESTK